jgi:anti-sigma factor (TIGR02949 family)
MGRGSKRDHGGDGGKVMADCSRVLDIVSAYIDGELPKNDSDEVEKHLDECSQCRQELAVLKMLITATNEIEAVDPPSELRTRIAAATTHKPVFNLRTSILERIAPVRSFLLAGGAACAAVAIVLFVMFGRVGEPVNEITTATKAATPAASPAVATQAEVETMAAEPVADDAVKTSPANRTSRIVTNKTSKRAVSVALVPETGIQPKIKSTRESDIYTDTADLGMEDSIVIDAIDNTTSARTVDMITIAQPATEAVDTTIEQLNTEPARIASSPAVSNDNAEQWMEEMKNEAAMHRKGSVHNGVSVINARF